MTSDRARLEQRFLANLGIRTVVIGDESWSLRAVGVTRAEGRSRTQQDAYHLRVSICRFERSRCFLPVVLPEAVQTSSEKPARRMFVTDFCASAALIHSANASKCARDVTCSLNPKTCD